MKYARKILRHTVGETEWYATQENPLNKGVTETEWHELKETDR
jgi:hypothetical protein